MKAQLSVGTFTIRPYVREKDAERVEEIVGLIWQGGGAALMEARFGVIGGKPWTHWQAASVLAYIEGESARAFVAEREGRVCGFCSYLVEPERKLATVGFNGVAPEAQGEGLGSLMMAHVMERIRAEGMAFAAVIVAANDAHAPARRIYQKYGFEDLCDSHYMVQKL